MGYHWVISRLLWRIFWRLQGPFCHRGIHFWGKWRRRKASRDSRQCMCCFKFNFRTEVTSP